MSYDLYFTGQRIPRAEFIDYFQQRGHYKINDNQVWYENKDTGVYFWFDYLDEDELYIDEDELDENEDNFSYFATFDLNYCRPHFFGLESEPELTAFVKKFGCGIYDPQSDGRVYSPEGFIYGWNSGNKCGYSSILRSQKPPEDIYTHPTAELERIWQWNYSRDRIYDDLGIDLFVPRIVFALVDNNLKTMCIWPDAIATLIPHTDIVYIGRKEFGLDDCIVDRSALDRILPDFDSSFPVAARNPAVETLPENIRNFVRDLQPFQGEISIVPHENVLNAEYILEFGKLAQTD